LTLKTIADDREVGRQGAVVVDQQDVFKALGSVATGELSNDFGSDRHPEVANSIRLADLFSVVQWCSELPLAMTKMFSGGKISNAAFKVGPMIFADL
jgi:hypothetical protein